MYGLGAPQQADAAVTIPPRPHALPRLANKPQRPRLIPSARHAELATTPHSACNVTLSILGAMHSVGCPTLGGADSSRCGRVSLECQSAEAPSEGTSWAYRIGQHAVSPATCCVLLLCHVRTQAPALFSSALRHPSCLVAVPSMPELSTQKSVPLVIACSLLFALPIIGHALCGVLL